MLISRLPNVGRPPNPVPEMLGHRDLQRQRHVVVVMRARRDVDVHADVLVVERGDRLLRRAAGGDRRERRHRHRHLLAESRLRRRCLRRSAAAGWPASACWCRSSAAGSRAPAGPPARMSDCDRLRSACSVRCPLVAPLIATLPFEPLMPGDPGDGDLQAVFRAACVRSTSSSSTSMITSGRALSIAAMHAAGGGDPLGRVLDRQRVGRGGRRDAPRVEHHAAAGPSSP